jgi:Bacteriocin-protection, YdeI or OmpD-Associated/Domain of unknown function (DUF1905)
MQGRRCAIATFRTTAEARPGGGIAIRLPFDPSAEWGEKDTHHITGTVAGCTVRGAVKTVGDDRYLELGPAWCRDAHLPPDAAVDVVLVPEGPQVDTLAPDIRAALQGAPEARRFFEALATAYRQGYVGWIEEAKRLSTREKRIAETIEALKAGKKQHAERPRR